MYRILDIAACQGSDFIGIIPLEDIEGVTSRGHTEDLYRLIDYSDSGSGRYRSGSIGECRRIVGTAIRGIFDGIRAIHVGDLGLVADRAARRCCIYDSRLPGEYESATQSARRYEEVGRIRQITGTVRRISTIECGNGFHVSVTVFCSS